MKFIRSFPEMWASTVPVGKLYLNVALGSASFDSCTSITSCFDIGKTSVLTFPPPG